MKRLLSLSFFVAAAFSLGVNAEVTPNGTEGHGGDALRQLFEKARISAAALTKELKPCSFQSNVPQEKADWILNHKATIIDDIRKAPYLWVVDSQSTCGFTQSTSKSAIYLSYPTCASTVGTDLSSAIFVVLHETAHHLGIQNEREADAFATAIQQADVKIECPSNPITDVFDPKICNGPTFSIEDALRYLPQGGSSASIGKYRTYGRIRYCNKVTGCQPWMIRQPMVDVSPNYLSEQKPAFQNISAQAPLDKTFPLSIYTDISTLGFHFEWKYSDFLLAFIKGDVDINNHTFYDQDAKVNFVPIEIRGTPDQGSFILETDNSSYEYTYYSSASGTFGHYYLRKAQAKSYVIIDKASGIIGGPGWTYKGALRKNCGWFSPGILSNGPDAAGNYSEQQLVVFGNH